MIRPHYQPDMTFDLKKPPHMQTSKTKLNTIILPVTLFVCLIVTACFRPAVSKALVSFEALPDAVVHGDFVVGPGKIEAELSPGESQTFELTVSNRLGTDKDFSISEEDFTGSQDPSQAVMLLGDDRGPYSLRDYVHVATTSIHINNGFRARIPVTISVPADAQPGGLYGSVIVGTVNHPSVASPTVGAVTTNAIVTRIGTLFFVRVKGPVLESGRLERFTMVGGREVFFDPSDMAFDLLYRNDGNVHTDPYGSITVTNIMGSPVGAIKVDPWFALPQSLRFREVDWKAPFLFGRYVARAEINRGYDNATDTAEVVFWVIPWKIMIAIFAGIVVILGAVRWIVGHVRFISKRR